ncbi:MAG TPA: M28 family peptidase [Bacteroidota bacterium]|nr:M28 family peptidase [Bacteroidota bacterium]
MHATIQMMMVSLLLVGCGDTKEKTPVPEYPAELRTKVPPVTIPAFDGGQAFAYLTRQTSFGPRNPNSAGHSACLDFLSAELRKHADNVRLQQFNESGYDGEKLVLTNVIASFKPDVKDRVLLCAHWDTRPRAEHDENKGRRNEPILGANDGASGVAVLLQIASMLKNQPPSIGVDIVLFDGEDYGLEGDDAKYLLGSRHFARNKILDYVPRFGILLDMIGDRFLEIPKEQHSLRYAPDVLELVWGKARELGYLQFVDEVGELVTDDHLPLNEVGIKTIDLIDFNYPDPTNRFWHSHQDIPENCSTESLEAVGTVLTHVIYSQQP